MTSSDNTTCESHDDEEDQEMSEEFHLCEEDQHKICKIGQSETSKSVSLAQCSRIEHYKHISYLCRTWIPWPWETMVTYEKETWLD
jgi:hypothetical protein